MNSKPFQITSLACLLITTLACATIVGNAVQVMPITSNPVDAEILIKDETGSDIFKGRTPTTVSLNKATGKYFGKKSYAVTIRKDGFEDQTVMVTGSANGWYIAGNLVFGGLIGWLIVDPLNGKMYNLSTEKISMDLRAKLPQPAVSTSTNALPILQLKDLPKELRGQLTLIPAHS